MRAFKHMVKNPSFRTFKRRIRLIFQFKYPYLIAKYSLFLRTIHVNSIEGYILNKIRTDRSKMLSVFADKYAVRRYISDIVGEQYLTKIFGVYNACKDLPWETFPREFVVKCSHSSGGIILVSNSAERISEYTVFDYRNWGKYLIHPLDFNHRKIEDFFSRMLSQNYAKYTDYFEFAYSQLDPVLIVEELLTDVNGDLPKDFKFWCFNGKVVLIQVDSHRYTNHVRNFYDREWNLLNVKVTYSNASEVLERPIKLIEMINLAETLSTDSVLLRVDLYELSDRILVGELTNYPGGGVEKFVPRSFSKKLYSILRSKNEIE